MPPTPPDGEQLLDVRFTIRGSRGSPSSRMTAPLEAALSHLIFHQ